MRHWQPRAVALSAAVALVVLLGGCANSDSRAPDSATNPPPESPAGVAEQTRAGETRRGELSGAGHARCVEEYTARAVAHRAFAFDGTVTGIGSDRNDLGYVPVTFTVNDWYRGSSTETVTVDMAPPQSTVHETSVSGGTYEVGSRLLVSGEPRWGGQAMADAIGWGCGFTRYYDASTAASWADATS